jgi:3-hydroxyacyl-[acyl-carrier-protein] dehydratase
MPYNSLVAAGAAVVHPWDKFAESSEMIELQHVHFEVQRTIGADHPSLPGHFPGAPIAPGVVILDEVLAALAEWRDDLHVKVISAVKFLVPLKPDQPFTICLAPDEHAESQINFRCSIEDRVIVEGRLQVHYGSD